MSTDTNQTLLLKDGERLSKQDFLERYESAPENFRAELLEGIVYVNAAAARAGNHGQPQFIVMRWLGEYYDQTPGVEIYGPTTTDLAAESMPEPDICMVINHTRYGQTRLSDEDYLTGPPELVVEIAASTVRKDMVVKKRIYEKAGVKEYVVWRTTQNELDWFVLRDGRYEMMDADTKDGFLKSEVFPGLWLDRDAMLERDVRKVVRQMQPGFRMDAHKEFVERLSR